LSTFEFDDARSEFVARISYTNRGIGTKAGQKIPEGTKAMATNNSRTYCLVLLSLSCLLHVSAQGTQASGAVTNADKSEIIRSVLKEETEGLLNQFRFIRKLSPENIPDNLIRELFSNGYTVLRSTKPGDGGFIEYLAFDRIEAVDNEIFVTVAIVTKDDPCFGEPRNNSVLRYYRYQKIDGEWKGGRAYGRSGRVALREHISSPNPNAACWIVDSGQLSHSRTSPSP
jgi:hypothetical protein